MNARCGDARHIPCVCESERGRERESKCERERERESKRERERKDERKGEWDRIEGTEEAPATI